jgi:hypothetical protein
MTAGTGFFTLNAKFPQTLPLGESRSSRVPSCPSRVPTSFGTRKPLQLQAFILTEPVNFAIFKKNLRHTCVTGKKSAFFSRFPRSIFKDQTPDRRPPSDRRLPACNERKREHLSCGSPHEVRAKDSSRDCAARSAAQDFVRY